MSAYWLNPSGFVVIEANDDCYFEQILGLDLGKDKPAEGVLTWADAKRPRVFFPSRKAARAAVIVKVPLDEAGKECLALARHLFDARTDAMALRKALQWAVLDAGRDLTPEQRRQIIERDPGGAQEPKE